jgi:hypothetical protein
MEAAHNTSAVAPISSRRFQTSMCLETLADAAEYRAVCVTLRIRFPPFLMLI